MAMIITTYTSYITNIILMIIVGNGDDDSDKEEYDHNNNYNNAFDDYGDYCHNTYGHKKQVDDNLMIQATIMIKLTCANTG